MFLLFCHGLDTYSTYDCFHLYIHFISYGSKRLQIKLLLGGPLSVRVQRIDQSLCGTALTHARPELRAFKVQIPQTIGVRVGQTSNIKQRHLTATKRHN